MQLKKRKKIWVTRNCSQRQRTTIHAEIILEPGDKPQEGLTLLSQKNGEMKRFLRHCEGRVQLFQYRVTPHTVTWGSPVELLMERKLRDKLPRVEFSKDHPTETYWQQLLSNAIALSKGICRQHKSSHLGGCDKVLLKKTSGNKLLLKYEPEPYVECYHLTRHILEQNCWTWINWQREDDL